MSHLKHEKLWYFGCSPKNPTFRGGGVSRKNWYKEGDCIKRGLGQFADLRRGLGKKDGGGVFEGGLMPRSTLWCIYVLLLFCVQPKYFHASNQGHILWYYVLHLLRQQPTMYIYVLIKWLFIDVLVVGYTFLWLLSYIYKALDMIEIMSNCNTNCQGRI